MEHVSPGHFHWKNIVPEYDGPDGKTAMLRTPNMTIVRALAYQGAAFPPHVHPCEVWLQVIAGEMRIDCGGESTILTSGSMYRVPANAVHSLEAIEDTQFLEFTAAADMVQTVVPPARAA